MSAVPVIAALLLAVFASPATAAWRPPVAGALTRPFTVSSNPFAAGQHRGIDLAAAPGAAVRAPCAGRVVVAGRVGTSGGVVTLRCGHWRVTHLPLATITVRAGTPVTRGARLGTVARSAASAVHTGTPFARGARLGAGHAGLHLGVRREGERFGYVDPLRFLTPAPSTPLPPLGRAPRGRDLPPPLARHAPRFFRRRGSPATPRALVRPARHVFVAPLTSPMATSLDLAARSDPSRLAPWPAWLGLALMLIGAGMRRRGATRTRTRLRIRATARFERMTSLVIGFGLGFLVAAQLGPISLLAIRSTLRSGVAIGLAIAAGVAIVDTLYAAAGAAGAAGLLAIEPLRLAFGVIGAAVLALLGARTLWSAFRVRQGGESREELATPRAAFVTSLAATASNPLTIASWAAVFAAASTAGAAGAGAGAALLLAGVGLGSLTCMSLLAGGVSVARRWVGPRMLRAVDGIAGVGILGFGGLLAFRTLRD